MAASAPWSVKGIDPKAREAAKDFARRSGMTLGEWLNQMILEENSEPDERPAYPTPSSQAQTASYARFEAPQHPGDEVMRATDALDRLSDRIEAAEHRAALAIGNIDKSVISILGRMEAAERDQTAVAARFEGAVSDLAGEQARLTERLRRVEETAAPLSVEAVHSVEDALAKVASRVYDGEAKAEQQFSTFRSEFDALSERLATQSSPTANEAMERLAERLSQAEARTAAAMRGLETSFAQLDQRLASAESRPQGFATQNSLEDLATALSARVDAARVEMADNIREAADSRFERIEHTLSEMTGHVALAERRSSHAIERMGHEVLRMADALGRQMQEVEHRSADAIEQVGGDVARMANSMEMRLARSDDSAARALEKLGGEIAGITERLAERIANAERRSAQAMDDVGEQVARVSERLQDRQERTSTELSERIRLSEERTARHLEDARERIDQRLEQTEKRLTERTQPPAVAEFAPAFFADSEVGPFGRENYNPPAYEPPAAAYSAPEPPPFHEMDHPDHIEPAIEAPLLDAATAFAADAPDLSEFSALEPEPRTFGGFGKEDLIEPAPIEDDDGFMRYAPEAAETPVEFAAAPPEPEDPAPMLESAFEDHAFLEPPASFDIALDAEQAGHDERFHDEAAHDHASLDWITAPEAVAELEAVAEPPAEPEPEVEPTPARPLTTRELIEQARAASRAATAAQNEKGAKAQKKAKRRGTSTLTAALVVSGGAAALSMALVGYEFVLQRPAGALPTRVADALGLGAPRTPLGSERPAAGEGGQPLAAVALSPTPATPAATVATTSAAQVEAGAEIYADGVRRVEAHDNSGVDAVRRAANLGYAPAEFYLAKLYESGGAGMKKDLVEARVWTDRAAQAGDSRAMHNLGLDYFEGVGGPKDTTQAAQWFHRAADLGLVDSQYNLARLYEEGFGVPQNPAEAYKWYLIAARAGDADSRAAAQRLKNQISPEAQAAAERSANGFQVQPHTLNATTTVATGGASSLATAQRALSRLGYYQGPYDGVNSPALSLAIAAYQRDQGLPSSGTLDPAVSQRLAAAAN